MELPKKSVDFTYVVDLRLSEPRKMFDERTYRRTHVGAVSRIFEKAQVYHRYRGDDREGTREFKHSLSSLFHMPFSSFHQYIEHDFSKRLTFSQCVICLSTDVKPKKTRMCVPVSISFSLMCLRRHIIILLFVLL